jgi:hypothetical protein
VRAQRWVALLLLAACACAWSAPCPSREAAQVARASLRAPHHAALADSAAEHGHTHAQAAAHDAHSHHVGRELELRAACPCGCDSPAPIAAAPGKPGSAHFLALTPPDFAGERSRPEAPTLTASLPAAPSPALDPIPRIC